MKEETLEEAAERNHNEQKLNTYTPYSFNDAFKDGAKWQAERMYSEEEVLNFTQIILSQYSVGNTNIEQLDLLKETLHIFKNK